MQTQIQFGSQFDSFQAGFRGKFRSGFGIGLGGRSAAGFEADLHAHLDGKRTGFDARSDATLAPDLEADCTFRGERRI